MAAVETKSHLKVEPYTRLSDRLAELVVKAKDVACPHCASDQVLLRTHAIIPAPWRCRSCGEKWSREP